MSTTRDRLKLAVIHRETSQTAIAERIGVAKQQVAKVASGRFKSGKIVEAVASDLRVPVEWLVYGTGDRVYTADEP